MFVDDSDSDSDSDIRRDTPTVQGQKQQGSSRCPMLVRNPLDDGPHSVRTAGRGILQPALPQPIGTGNVDQDLAFISVRIQDQIGQGLPGVLGAGVVAWRSRGGCDGLRRPLRPSAKAGNGVVCGFGQKVLQAGISAGLATNHRGRVDPETGRDFRETQQPQRPPAGRQYAVTGREPV